MISLTPILLLGAIVIGGLVFYVQYRLFVAGKMTIRPVMQGLISLVIAIALFVGSVLLVASLMG